MEYIREDGTFYFQYSAFVFEEKPDYTTDGAKMAQTWRNYEESYVNLDQMALGISQGRTFRTGLFDRNVCRFRKVNAIGAMFIVLDFDDTDFTPHDVVEFGTAHDLRPTMWYYSFSQGKKEKNNFRIIWVLDDIMNPSEFDRTMAYIYDLFSKFEPDPATKDISRMWYPGAMGVEITNYDKISWTDLQAILPAPVNTSVVDKVHRESNLDLSGAKFLPVINWEKDLDEHCPIWNKFKSGKRLHRQERMVLFSNIRLLKGGYERVLELIDWDMYEEDNSNFSIREIDRWWEQDLKPARIIEVRGKNPQSVAEYFADRAF